MDYNQGIPGEKLVKPRCPRLAAGAAHPVDLAGKGSVPMKNIFRPVLTAVLLVSSVFWTAGSFAQATASDNKPVASQSTPAATNSAPTTVIPAGAQSIPAATQPAASQPAPAATQPLKVDQPASSDAAQQPATDGQQADQKDTFKHDGGKDDVDAIGNRKGVGGRGLGNWYSYEKEIAMGKEYAQQIESSVKLIQDPVVTEYVNRVGQNLVRNSDAKVPFTIKVIDSDDINAMALPGGFFYVNSGLIMAADEEAELAGVMAHEIAHVAARHASRQMTRGQWANLGTIPLIFVGGGIGYAVRSAAGFGLPMTFLTFQRGFEAEADYLGLQYMYKSGYDPNAFISFFEKVQAKEKKKPGTLAKAFSTHPQTPDRISKSQEEIGRILPARAQYVVTTSEFDTVKSRLAALENRRKVVDEKESGKPSLRRTASKDKTTSDKSADDDRPTLKRRDDQNQN